MVLGPYSELRATATVANGAVPEAAPTASTFQKSLGGSRENVEVRIGAIVTTGSPTAVTLRVYVRLQPDVVVAWEDIVVSMSSNAISGIPPVVLLENVNADAISLAFFSFTAGSSPAISSFDFKVRSTP